MAQFKPVVHVVDDDESFRMAIMRLLKVAGYEVRGYASSGDFLLSPSSSELGCLVLDVRMPGPSGLELQEALREQGKSLPVIFLTGHGDIPMSVQAMKSGAVDFLTKPVQREALLDSIAAALELGESKRELEQHALAVRERYQSLTTRERSVFALVVQGKLNKQIAVELGIAERTVKAHRSQVMSKMQVDSLAALARLAEQLSLDGEGS